LISGRFICFEVVAVSFSRLVAFAAIPAYFVLHTAPAAAQSFDDRWSIIPKAHAEPSPSAPETETQRFLRALPPLPAVDEPVPSTRDHAADPAPDQPPKQAFSGKASFYSYPSGKTANGDSFDRDGLTAAHRTLPFGTHVRVTDPSTGKSVVVEITDRGPAIRDRVLDLSMEAARVLGITDRGVTEIRAEVL
jgi:rare lipoprotein A